MVEPAPKVGEFEIDHLDSMFTSECLGLSEGLEHIYLL
jgi:hypothetical protein